MAVAAVALALVGGVLVLVLVAGLVRTLVALLGERPDRAEVADRG